MAEIYQHLTGLLKQEFFPRNKKMLFQDKFI